MRYKLVLMRSGEMKKINLSIGLSAILSASVLFFHFYQGGNFGRDICLLIAGLMGVAYAKRNLRIGFDKNKNEVLSPLGDVSKRYWLTGVVLGTLIVQGIQVITTLLG